MKPNALQLLVLILATPMLALRVIFKPIQAVLLIVLKLVIFVLEKSLNFLKQFSNDLIELGNWKKLDDLDI